MTKRIIAALSVSLGLVFAVALVNANTDDSSNMNSNSNTTSQQQPGQAAEKPATCTDQNGMVYNKGTADYDTCLKAQQVPPSANQPGQAGSDQNNGSTSNDSGSGSTSNQ